MPNYKYGTKIEGAKAQLYNVDSSYKDLAEVCGNIQGKKLLDAEKLLTDVASGEKPILFKKFNKRMAHRAELGGKKGRYPHKSAKIVLQVLENAAANAVTKGMNKEKLMVSHASANKQDIYERSAPRGRWRVNNYETARIEIVLTEGS